MSKSRSELRREIAGVFFRLGVFGFGGPAAHIAMMRNEVVRNRKWLDDSEFLELVGAVNLIPGPNSTELAIHLGHRRGGRTGLLVAGLCFIIPAVVITSLLAWLYASHGTSPEMVDIRYGVMPVIAAIIAHAVVSMGRGLATDLQKFAVCIGSFTVYVAGANELLILGAAAALAAVTARSRDGEVLLLHIPILIAAQSASLWRLSLTFLEIGSVLFGSGYVLVAFLQRNFVDDLGWLTETQVLDAVAVGQITPGPVFSSATFVGWQIAGVAGAGLATIGIFAPSFAFSATLNSVLKWMRSGVRTRAVLVGLSSASIGLMAGALVDIVNTAVVDTFTLCLMIISLGVMLVLKLNATWLVAGGVVVGAIGAFV